MNEKIDNKKTPEWSVVCIKLLQGPITRKSSNDKIWNLLLRDRNYIDKYFSTIGLNLLVEEADGYAFLRQKDSGTDEDFDDVPRLIRRVRLSPEESFLCVILREALDYFETSDNLSEICVLTESEIIDRLKDYSPEYTDQLKFKSKIRISLNKLAELGYVEDLTKKDINETQPEENHTFEIKKIIRAIVSPEFLEEFSAKLKERNAQDNSQVNPDNVNMEKEEGENDE